MTGKQPLVPGCTVGTQGLVPAGQPDKKAHPGCAFFILALSIIMSGVQSQLEEACYRRCVIMRRGRWPRSLLVSLLSSLPYGVWKVSSALAQVLLRQPL